MRLALLGIDADLLAVADAATAGGAAEVVWACDVAQPEQLARVLPRLRAVDDWESLLDVGLVDAVLVARAVDEDVRVEQLRKLIQAGVPLMLSHPVCPTALLLHELEMIRQESGSVVVALTPERRHPHVQRLAEMIRLGERGALGPIDHIVLERRLADRSRAAVLRQLARDADLVRSLGGDILRLGAMGAARETSYANLTVHLTAAQGCGVRWSVLPAEGSEGGRLIVSGPHGKAVLHLPPEQQRMSVCGDSARRGVPPPSEAQREPPDANPDWQLEITAYGEPRTEPPPAWDPRRDALDSLREALSGRRIAPSEPADRADLIDAARAMDIVDTVEASLRRGRVIDLDNELITEERTFKGAMGIAGCGLLLFALVSFVVMVIGENLARHAGMPGLARLLGKWPYVLAVLSVVFLLLQFMRLAIPKRPR